MVQSTAKRLAIARTLSYMSEPFLGGMLLNPSTFETFMAAFITDQSVGAGKSFINPYLVFCLAWASGGASPVSC
jgi:hypothetical protein